MVGFFSGRGVNDQRWNVEEGAADDYSNQWLLAENAPGLIFGVTVPRPLTLRRRILLRLWASAASLSSAGDSAGACLYHRRLQRT